MENNTFEVKLENLKKNVAARESTRVVKLPFWAEVKRGTPNSFLRSALFSSIQSKDRGFMNEETLFSQQGIVVKFTGNQLNQEDLTLWQVLIHFYKEQPLGDEIEFTAYKILKLLELDTNSDGYKRLHTGIIRLTACAVEITHDKKTYFGALIKSGRKDEVTKTYTLELDKKLIQLFDEDAWTAIDSQQRIDLRRKPLAQALHAYFSSHKTPYPVSIAFLQQLTGSRNSQLASFKRHVCAALDVLVAIGFLKDYSVVDGLVSVRRSAILLK